MTAADVSVVRLGPGDEALAQRTFTLMAAVFEQDRQPTSDAYVGDLLARPGFWALAATVGGDVVGGLTAHTLPMTTGERAELFLYDIAVRPDRQRRGVGRRLVEQLRHLGAAGGIDVVFVPADDDDLHALDFYRALGGVPAAVTMFDFGP